MKVLIGVNSLWNILNFRAGLVRALVADGHDVCVAAPRDDNAAAVESLGCRVIHLGMTPRGRVPWEEAKVLGSYLKLFKTERPDCYLSFTPKPTLYGSLAAWLARVPTIINITGLGHMENETGWVARLVRRTYHFVLSKAARIFFQNTVDYAALTGQNEDLRAKSRLLPGSGVDTHRFAAQPLPGGKQIRFLLLARLLWEKGIGEFAEAASQVRRVYPNAQFQLAGFYDDDAHAGVDRQSVERWVAAGDIEFLGAFDDVRALLAQADCVVLPTYYREGTPRTLLEAGAIGRPIITCDMPGCRDVVDNSESGFLVEPRSTESLVTALIKMIECGPDRRAAMGTAARAKVEREYDEALVIDFYRSAIHEVG